MVYFVIYKQDIVISVAYLHRFTIANDGNISGKIKELPERKIGSFKSIM